MSLLTDFFNTVPTSEEIINLCYESIRYNAFALETDAQMIDMNNTLLILKSGTIYTLQGFKTLEGFADKKSRLNRLKSDK